MKRFTTRLAMALMLVACDASDEAGGTTIDTDTHLDTGATGSEPEDTSIVAGASDTGMVTGSDSTTGSESESAETVWPDGGIVTIDFVYDRLQQGDPEMLLINVSDEEFYDMGHIAGSLKIPWDLLPDRLDEVPAERRIVVYCRKGVRSKSAYETLTAATYPRVWLMENGLEAWIAAGYPTVSE